MAGIEANPTGFYRPQEALHGFGGGGVKADMLQRQSNTTFEAAFRLVIERRDGDFGRAGHRRLVITGSGGGYGRQGSGLLALNAWLPIFAGRAALERSRRRRGEGVVDIVGSSRER
ncbi:hypothetical protein Ct61P_08283 [Colletotrichum tofieldiae]|nr:hypothetical protein Ct61P_08283 [Colletotrichum tofieldiae]